MLRLGTSHAALATLVLVLGTAVLAACGGDGVVQPPAERQVATVDVTPVADTLTAIANMRQFTAIAKDAEGNTVSGKMFTWSSSDPSVAAVDPATGLTTAQDNGTTNITATVDGVSGSVSLVVAQQVALVTVTPGSAGINAGQTQQFSAEATDTNGNPVSGVRFLWVSSNSNVAVVDTTGLATGVGRGDAIITAVGRGEPGNTVLSVAVPAGRLLVASTNDNAVYVYDPVTLMQLNSFTVASPISVAVGPDGRFYAGGSGIVEAIDPSTGNTTSLGSGIIAGAIYGTTVSDAGIIYTSGSGMADVRTMDLTGTAAGNIASPGGSNLRSTAFGPDGSFYLTSFTGGPVQRWLSGFVYDVAFGGGGLSAAFGIVVRASGQVVVADQNAAAYYRFSREGVFLGSVAVNCTGQIRNLAVDHLDNIWIGCHGQNEVVKFDAQDREVARLSVNSPSGVGFEKP